MTSSEKNLDRFTTIANTWISFLEIYTEEQLLRKPSDEEWSLGQVYNHLIASALFFHLKQIEMCAAGNGRVRRGGKTVKGKISYLVGSFPPIRVKVPPSPHYTPKQPADKNDLRERLHETVRSITQAKSLVDSSSPDMKTFHPAFGFLNSHEWYQLIPMHYRHHLRQKKQLDIYLSTYHV